MRVTETTPLFFPELSQVTGEPHRVVFLADPLYFFGYDVGDSKGHHVVWLREKPGFDESEREKLVDALLSEMVNKHPEYTIETEKCINTRYIGDSGEKQGTLVKFVHRNPDFQDAPYYVVISSITFGGVHPRTIAHIFQTRETLMRAYDNGTYADLQDIGEGNSELDAGWVGGPLKHTIDDNRGEAIGFEVPPAVAKTFLSAGVLTIDIESSLILGKVN